MRTRSNGRKKKKTKTKTETVIETRERVMGSFLGLPARAARMPSRQATMVQRRKRGISLRSPGLVGAARLSTVSTGAPSATVSALSHQQLLIGNGSQCMVNTIKGCADLQRKCVIKWFCKMSNK